VLLADSSGGLVQLPAPDTLLIESALQGTLDEQGALDGTLEMRVEGALAASAAREVRAMSNAERADLGVRVFLRDWGAAARLEPVSVWHDSALGVVILRARFHLPAAARRSGGSWVLRPLYASPRLPPPPDSARTLAYELGGPSRLMDRIEIALPGRWRASSLPDLSWSGRPGAYRLRGEQRDDRLHIERELLHAVPQVPAEEYHALLELARVASRGDRSGTLLVPGGP
jgi:hypothetical protein